MITVTDLIDLWKADGYDLEIEWQQSENESTWTLYYTQFSYREYEYRRHSYILVESIPNNAGEQVVKRSRILSFRTCYDDVNSMIHEAENLMELNWGDELHGIHE